MEYYESSKEFHLEKEAHDFWELTYVDNGVLQCIVDKESIQIKQGELLLIPPNTDHQYQNENGKPVTLLFLCFSAQSPILKTLQGKHKLSNELTEILLKMIAEIRSTFTFTFRSDIHFIDTPEIGGQQLMQNYLVADLMIKITNIVVHIYTTNLWQVQKQLL